MWSIEPTDTYERRLKTAVKDYPRELKATLGNLQTYFTALQEGVKPLQLRERLRFVHNEREGVYAVDQKGGGKNLAEMRLYVYPDMANCVLYLLTIGDKRSQPRDIKDCRDMVADIPRHGGITHGGQSGTDQAGQKGEVQNRSGDGTRPVG